MRIVHVLLTKNFAGTERYVIELAAEQAKKHDVHLILHKKGFGERESSIAWRVDPNVTVHKVGRPIRQWTFLQVRTLIKKLSPDIVHTHLKAASKSVKGLPATFTCLATMHIDYAAAEHDHLKGLIAITPFQQRRVAEFSKVPAVQIDNWVSGFSATAEEAQLLRRKFGVKDSDILIGSLGRLESSKRPDMMIEACEFLNASNVRIAVIGAGREEPALRARHPKVIMPGYSAQPKVWMRAFDIFVSSAELEPFGLVFLEAMQAGTPIVATATEGARHLANTTEFTLTPLDDLATLKVAIKRQVELAPRRVEYSLEKYGVAQKSQQVLAFYQQLKSLTSNSH